MPSMLNPEEWEEFADFIGWNAFGGGEEEAHTSHWALFILGLVVIGGILAGIAWAISLIPFKSAFGYIVMKFGVFWLQLLVGFLVLAMGWLAFRYKLLDQRTYGFVELLFAWLAGFFIALQHTTDLPDQWPALVGFAYVVSRGLGNIHDAGKTDKMPAKTTSP